MIRSHYPYIIFLHHQKITDLTVHKSFTQHQETTRADNSSVAHVLTCVTHYMLNHLESPCDHDHSYVPCEQYVEQPLVMLSTLHNWSHFDWWLSQLQSQSQATIAIKKVATANNPVDMMTKSVPLQYKFNNCFMWLLLLFFFSILHKPIIFCHTHNKMVSKFPLFQHWMIQYQ